MVDVFRLSLYWRFLAFYGFMGKDGVTARDMPVNRVTEAALLAM